MVEEARQKAKAGLEDNIICRVQDLPTFDWRRVEVDILIHDGNVYLVEDLGDLHGQVAGLLSFTITQQLNSKLNGLIFFSAPIGTYDHWVNELGCHNIQGKIADHGVSIGSLGMGPRRPVVPAPLVVEVAHHNESLGLLMVEGAGWVNIFTDVGYAVLFKMTGDRPSPPNKMTFRLIVVEREVGFAIDIASLVPKIGGECTDFSTGRVFYCQTQELMDKFGVRIIYDQAFNTVNFPTSLPPLILRADLLFRSTNIPHQKSDTVIFTLDYFLRELKFIISS